MLVIPRVWRSFPINVPFEQSSERANELSSCANAFSIQSEMLELRGFRREREFRREGEGVQEGTGLLLLAPDQLVS